MHLGVGLQEAGVGRGLLGGGLAGDVEQQRRHVDPQHLAGLDHLGDGQAGLAAAATDVEHLLARTERGLAHDVRADRGDLAIEALVQKRPGAALGVIPVLDFLRVRVGSVRGHDGPSPDFRHMS